MENKESDTVGMNYEFYAVQLIDFLEIRPIPHQATEAVAALYNLGKIRYEKGNSWKGTKDDFILMIVPAYDILFCTEKGGDVKEPGMLFIRDKNLVVEVAVEWRKRYPEEEVIILSEA